MSTIIETGIDYQRLDDVKYMRSYIMRLNEDLRYMLSNMDPEDNFDPDSLTTWQQYGKLANGITRTAEELKISMTNSKSRMNAAIEQRANEIDLRVSNVTEAINQRLMISSDKIMISASRLHVFSDNFTLDNDRLEITGEIRSNEGSFGGFVIANDANGNPYLQCDSTGTISGGEMSGTEGHFKIFRCAGTDDDHRSTMELDEARVNLKSCHITSNGMYFSGDLRCLGNLNAAKYVPSTDSYTDRRQIFVEGTLSTKQNIWVQVYSGTTDSGLVQCYSVYSYLAGGEYSDRSLKYDLEELDGQLATEMIKDLRPVHFKYLDEDTDNLGMIAQDIIDFQDKYSDMGMIGVNEDGYYTIDYSRFIPIIASAVKEIDRKLHGSI